MYGNLQSGMSETNFQSWLGKLVQDYRSLTSEEKSQTLDKLISCSEADQLNYLSVVLPQLLFRDFISLLPREVTYHILKYLPMKSLLTCVTVSHSWNTIVHQQARIWWQKAVQAGATDVAYYSSTKASRKYKALCHQVMKTLDSCNTGDCFHEYFLEGHNNRVMAVCYLNGRIATGSDDQSVYVWDAHTGKSLYKISTHTVCDIRLSSKYVYTASFDGTAACWDLATGALYHHFVGHTSAVFSIDVAEESGLVLTGSSDKSIKVWSKEPSLLMTLEDCHSDWVTKVQFLSPLEPSSHLLFASVDKNVCHVWRSDQTGHCEKVSSTKKQSGVQITSFFHRCAGVFHLCTWRDKELCNHLVTYSFSHDKLTLLTTVPLGGDIPLRCHLLGAGLKFAAVTSSSEINRVFVFNLNQNRCVARIQIPSCRSTRNGATLTLGDCSWLDGFDGTVPEGTLMAACLQNSCQILLVNWKH